MAKRKKSLHKTWWSYGTRIDAMQIKEDTLLLCKELYDSGKITVSQLQSANISIMEEFG